MVHRDQYLLAFRLSTAQANHIFVVNLCSVPYIQNVPSVFKVSLSTILIKSKINKDKRTVFGELIVGLQAILPEVVTYNDVNQGKAKVG